MFKWELKKSSTLSNAIIRALWLYLTVTPLKEHLSKKYWLNSGVLITTPERLTISPILEIVSVQSLLIIFRFGKLSNVIPSMRKGLSKPCLALSIDIKFIFPSFLKNLEYIFLHAASGVRSSSAPVIIKSGVSVLYDELNVNPQ